MLFIIILQINKFKLKKKVFKINNLFYLTLYLKHLKYKQFNVLFYNAPKYDFYKIMKLKSFLIYFTLRYCIIYHLWNKNKWIYLIKNI